MKKTGISAQSVEFGVVTAKGMTPMYIALFKVRGQIAITFNFVFQLLFAVVGEMSINEKFYSAI